jgi:hypothetical protein
LPTSRSLLRASERVGQPSRAKLSLIRIQCSTRRPRGRNAVRELVGWVKAGGDGGFQCGIGGIGDRAVGLPKDVAVGSGEEDVGVIGRGEVDQFFPLVLMIKERDEMRMLRGRNVFAHAADDGAVDERWGALQFGELIDGDVTIVGRKVGGEALAPSGRLRAALVGEADGEDEVLGTVRFWEDDLGIVEGFAFDGWDGLGIERRCRKNGLQENCGQKSHRRSRQAQH